MTHVSSVNIRPGVNVLSVLPHLNYKAWFALAEFVDNSIQSSINQKKRLIETDGNTYKLRVEITFCPRDKRITITDNAAGIFSGEYQRAFRPAEIPPNATGLSEFGMGMKSAACWFSPSWSVRSTALGEDIERTIIFNVEEIVNDSIEELAVLSTNVSGGKHYTEIQLDKIRRFPRGNTIKKIKEHLSSIYRVFIRERSLELFVDGERLEFEDPEILIAPSYRTPDGPKLEWKREIAFDLGDGKSASGFVAIRKTANTRLAGLALFRRKRLIMGSADEAYRPEDIFGRPNTYQYQRVFGEIHLKGFYVSHTKDGIKWEESEDEFLSKLRQELSSESLPLLQQAREHRSKSSVKSNRKEAAVALQSLASNLQQSEMVPAPGTSTSPADENPLSTGTSPNVSYTDEPPLGELPTNEVEVASFAMKFRNEPWIVRVELSYSESFAEWLSIKDTPSIADPAPRVITIRIAMLHPFMAQFPTMDSDSFTAVLNIASAIALAEIAAGESADKRPSVIRRYTNEILKNQMSRRLMDD